MILSVVIAIPLFSQTGRAEVKFPSKDSLEITADIYMLSDTLPFLVLIHEQGSSRGEFMKIISRFQKMNFNCLVPDIRNGGNSNVVANETANKAKKENHKITPSLILSDIEAAVNYAYNRSDRKVVLIGAGANGSLALLLATNSDQIKAIATFSPGEFFKPEISIEEEISAIQVPVLVTATKAEFPYIQQLLSRVDPELKAIYAPEYPTGNRGTNAFYPENKSNLEYWLSILLFFNNLN